MTTATEPVLEAPEHPEGGAPHGHPTAATYWQIGLVLGLLTALEVSTYWWPEGWHRVTHISLIVMMVIKFALVVLFFMHLKFDNKVLGRLFVFGMVMALIVYIGTLSAMTFWSHSGTPEFNDAPREKPLPPPPTASP